MTLSNQPPMTMTLDRARNGYGADGLIVGLPAGEVVTVIHRTGSKVQVRWRGKPLVMDAGAIEQAK